MIYKYSNNINFYPWVGELYEKDNIFNSKILILGESHYSDVGNPEMDKNLTISLTESYMKGEWRHKFWTNISQVLMNKEYWNLNLKEIWSSLAFYNYVQNFVIGGARIAPEQNLWKISINPFFEVLKLLNPDGVLVLGKRLWSNLPEEHFIKLDFKIVENYDFGFYRIENKKIPFACIRHPSSGFNYRKWSPVFIKLLELSKNQ